MRKLLILGAALLLSVFIYSQSAIVEVQGSAQVCSGLGPANQVKVTVLTGKTPFNSIQKHHKAYIWIAEHENGTKVWYSNQSQRWIPIPWAGQYRVHAKVEYLLQGRTRPFSLVSSNKVIITGVNCN